MKKRKKRKKKRKKNREEEEYYENIKDKTIKLLEVFGMNEDFVDEIFSFFQ